jgi:hypothetical protein
MFSRRRFVRACATCFGAIAWACGAGPAAEALPLAAEPRAVAPIVAAKPRGPVPIAAHNVSRIAKLWEVAVGGFGKAVAVDRTQGLVAVSSGVALKLYDLWSGKPIRKKWMKFWQRKKANNSTTKPRRARRKAKENQKQL